jgi:hemolysin III
VFDQDTPVMIKGERFNSISHLAGAVLALAGAVVLVVVASRDGDTRRIVSFSIYGATLFLLYLISTLYHGLPTGRAKHVFRVLDHQAIYLLMPAATRRYTGRARRYCGLADVWCDLGHGGAGSVA